MLHGLSQSESYIALSLKAKVLWTMLIADCDDQGRFLALPDAVKWTFAPRVKDLSVEDVGGALLEMEAEGMILVYGSDRQYGQLLHWWEYQKPRWARPSNYPPPDGWQDRVNIRSGDAILSEGWDAKGGFGECLPTDGGQGVRQSVRDSGSDSDSVSDRNTTTTPTLSSIWFDLTGQSYGQIVAEEIDALEEDYPRDWVIDAMKEAVKSSKGPPNIKYLMAILTRWKTEGKGSKPHGKSRRSDLSPERIAQRAEFDRAAEADSRRQAIEYGIDDA